MKKQITLTYLTIEPLFERIFKPEKSSPVSTGNLQRYISATETEIRRARQAGNLKRALELSEKLVGLMSDKNVMQRARVKEYAIRNHRGFIAGVYLTWGDADSAVAALSMGSSVKPGLLDTRLAYRQAIERGDVPFRVLHAFALGAPMPETPSRDSLEFTIEHAWACLRGVSEKTNRMKRPAPVTRLDGVDVSEVIALLDHQLSGFIQHHPRHLNRDDPSYVPIGTLRLGYKTLITLYQASGDFANAATTEEEMRRVMFRGKPSHTRD